MIPKIVHCCWFGGKPLPKSVKKFIKTWKDKLPGYKIKIWTEADFDPVSSIPYVKEAYASSKYAFVSDYVRLYALYHYGGIYLDTDVEVLQTFNPFLENESFMGFECDDRLSTAIIASTPQAKWLRILMEGYETRRFIKAGQMDLTTNVEFITNYFEGLGLQKNGEMQSVLGVQIYPPEIFSPKSWDTGKYEITENTVTVHHFAGTWHSRSTRMLSLCFSNDTIVKIASLKERIVKSIKHVFS